MIGSPSNADYIHVVQNKLIPNIPITLQDIKNATLIYGKDLGAIQGKSVRKTSRAVTPDYISLPTNLQDQPIILAADTMFINGIPFFVTVSRHIHYYTGELLNDQSKENLLDALIKVCNLYKSRGLQVKMCRMDNQFGVLKEPFKIKYLSVELDIWEPDGHVPKIERGIRIYQRILEKRSRKIEQ